MVQIRKIILYTYYYYFIPLCLTGVKHRQPTPAATQPASNHDTSCTTHESCTPCVALAGTHHNLVAPLAQHNNLIAPPWFRRRNFEPLTLVARIVRTRHSTSHPCSRNPHRTNQLCGNHTHDTHTIQSSSKATRNLAPSRSTSHNSTLDFTIALRVAQYTPNTHTSLPRRRRRGSEGQNSDREGERSENLRGKEETAERERENKVSDLFILILLFISYL